MIKQVSAGIVVYHVTSQGIMEYLVLQYGAGHWDFAKGKLEDGETKIEAAIRELHEETELSGVEIKPGFEESLLYRFKDFTGKMIEKTVHFFVGQLLEKGEVQLSHEHKDYKWLPYNQAIQLLTYQNAKDVLSHADAFLNAYK